MANEEHLAIFRQGVEAWNKWRKENPKIKPDLAYADRTSRPLNIKVKIMFIFCIRPD